MYSPPTAVGVSNDSNRLSKC